LQTIDSPFGTRLSAYMPTLIKPKPWDGPRDGGYWTPYVKAPFLIRFKASHEDQRQRAIDEYEALDMPEVYEAINNVQNTAWKINKPVFDVAKKITLITTSNGAPYKIKSLSNLFKDWFVEAGIPECSVHSLRKAASTIAAENGATESDLQALFGWTTLAQAALYTRAANRKKLALRSAHLITLNESK